MTGDRFGLYYPEMRFDSGWLRLGALYRPKLARTGVLGGRTAAIGPAGFAGRELRRARPGLWCHSVIAVNRLLTLRGARPEGLAHGVR